MYTPSPPHCTSPPMGGAPGDADMDTCFTEQVMNQTNCLTQTGRVAMDTTGASDSPSLCGCTVNDNKVYMALQDSPDRCHPSSPLSVLNCGVGEDTHSWTTKIAEHWNEDDTLNWVQTVAAVAGFCLEEFKGENFNRLSGNDLCEMKEKDFLARDDQYGMILYDHFRHLQYKVKGFIPPMEKEDEIDMMSIRSVDDHRSRSPMLSSVAGFPYEPELYIDTCGPQQDGPLPDLAALRGDLTLDSSDEGNINVKIGSFKYDIDGKEDWIEGGSSGYSSDGSYASGVDGVLPPVLTMMPQMQSPHHHCQQQQQPLSPQQPQPAHSHHPPSHHIYMSEAHQGASYAGLSVMNEVIPPHHQPLRHGYSHMAAQQSADSDYQRPLHASMHPRSPCHQQKRPGRPKKIWKRTDDSSAANRANRGRKQGQTTKGAHLWEFIRDLLHDSKYNPHIIKWERPTEGIFRIVKSKEVAKLWGQKKHNDTMNYEKLSRAMRFCREHNVFAEVPKDGSLPKKLCFKFGEKAHSWQQ